MTTKTPDLDEITPAELFRLIGRETNGSDVTAEEVAAFLAAGHDPKLEERVLGYLSRMAKRVKKAVLAGEPTPEVVVRPAHRGRVTGFSLACSCGTVASKLAPNRRAGALAAAGHLRLDHDGDGTIDLR